MEEIFQRNRLALILKTGDLRLWFYHPSTRHYFYLSEDGSKEERLNPVEFSQRFDRGDFEELSRQVFEICDGHVEKVSVLLRSSEQGEACRYYQVSIAVSIAVSRKWIACCYAIIPFSTRRCWTCCSTTRTEC